MVSRVRLLFVVLAGCLFVAAAARAEDGAALYKAKCVMCHGADGKGDTTMGRKLALKALSSAEIQKKSDTDLAKVIRDGKGKMPAFKKLTPGEVKAVVTVVRSFGK